MNCTLATVSKIVSCSFVDGPGNRFVLFLQGCNFHCQGCHNPHTIGICDHCGECVPVCETGALSMKAGRVVFDAGACDECDECLTACPIDANPMVRDYGVEDVLALVRPRRPFLSGITVSGGEPTLQLAFVVELFAAIKAEPALRGLSCFIDSNGFLEPGAWETLLPVTDGVMIDIKAFSPAKHQALTGQSNGETLRSARMVHAAGRLYELRFLLIRGVTDDSAELDCLADFVRSLGSDTRVKLNAFQRHGVRGPARSWKPMTERGVVAAAEHLRAAGLKNIVRPVVYL
jgi:pyruvate formate lyase activating enzyme